jgi:uncharacterized protein YfaQ (DUF2300 family)
MQASKQLTLVVDELVSAHDDTIRLAGDLAVGDWRWEEHVAYLRDLTRLGRATLVAASDCGLTGRRSRPRSRQRTRGARRCAPNGHDEGPA